MNSWFLEELTYTPRWHAFLTRAISQGLEILPQELVLGRKRLWILQAIMIVWTFSAFCMHVGGNHIGSRVFVMHMKLIQSAHVGEADRWLRWQGFSQQSPCRSQSSSFRPSTKTRWRTCICIHTYICVYIKDPSNLFWNSSQSIQVTSIQVTSIQVTSIQVTSIQSQSIQVTSIQSQSIQVTKYSSHKVFKSQFLVTHVLTRVTNSHHMCAHIHHSTYLSLHSNSLTVQARREYDQNAGSPGTRPHLFRRCRWRPPLPWNNTMLC